MNIFFIYEPIFSRITSITDPKGPKTEFGYDELSRRTSLRLPNGITAGYTYDPASQLKSLVWKLNAQTLSSFSYQYNRIGLRTSLTDLVTHKDTSTDGGLHSYGYDVLNRLTSAAHPATQQTFNPSETFTYDPVGNRLSDITSPTYTYDLANRILEDALYIYEFDANGNMTSKTEKATGKKTTYTYDAENQLIRIDFPDGIWVTYRYDGLGRRFEKNINGIITRYLYDNEDILLELDNANNVIARYTHGIGIDEPLIMEQGNNSYFYTSDGLGSISQLTDSQGNVIASYIYNSFGKIVKKTGNLANPYTYTAREYDPESGLYYYRARYYDARIGRFLQEDYIFGLHLYTYVDNMPLNFTDAYGLDFWEWLRSRPEAFIDVTITQARTTYGFWKEAFTGGIDWSSFGQATPGSAAWLTEKYAAERWGTEIGCYFGRGMQIVMGGALTAEITIGGIAIGTAKPFIFQGGSRGGMQFLIANSWRIVTKPPSNILGIVKVGAGQVFHIGFHRLPGFAQKVLHIGLAGGRHIPIMW
jgi:RHS repeat-associated protein